VNSIISHHNYFEGWSFRTLTETSSAVALAKQIAKKYVEDPQNPSGEHENTKTLSLIDTESKFPILVQALDAYLGLLIELLSGGKNTDLFTLLHRARYQDNVVIYNQQKHFVDMGSLFREVGSLCDPDPQSELAQKSVQLMAAFDSIFLERVFGPSTVEGTGMYVTIPFLDEYNDDKEYWDTVLFPNSIRQDIPNYQTFWTTYVAGPRDEEITGESVCRGQLRQPINTQKFGSEAKFIDPRIHVNDEEIEITTAVAPSVVAIKARYGLDVTEVAAPPSRRRHLRLRDLEAQAAAPEEEILIMYGGTIPGNFDPSEVLEYDFSATWNRKFYVIMEAKDADATSQPIFVEGSMDPEKTKNIDVIYFDANNAVKDSLVFNSKSIEEAKSLGGIKGHLEFHLDRETGKESFTLFSDLCRKKMTAPGIFEDVCFPEEIMPEKGGFVTPILPMRGKILGKEVTEIVGGKTGRVLRWSEDTPLHVDSMSDLATQDTIGASSVVLEMEATGHDGEERDFHAFRLADDGSQRKTDLTANGNLATCKTALQSTTIEGAVASQAITGDRVTLAHTDRENSPWWMVDLLDDHLIESVLIVNRQDCCQERLDGVKVELLNAEGQTVASKQHNPEQEGPMGNEWTVAFDNQSARKVRVSTAWPEGKLEFLNLAAVEVIGTCTSKDTCKERQGCDYGDGKQTVENFWVQIQNEDWQNHWVRGMPLTPYFLLIYPVALCKPTDQSTTIGPVGNDFTPGLSSYANDGTPALSHTTCEQAPWWEVDLLSPRAIDNVVIKNRQDCCFERLNGLMVELLDGTGQVVESFQRKSVKNWVRICSKFMSCSNPFYGCCVFDFF